ncbi:pyrroloquinoline quinone precursor peptide PqqA [Novosphingobium sp. CCH12-A3]|uniref:pyrroloquinoline quinone precursor peptide PqqA n=1 Tax=Novosphingobium sp. CCH12-A3 TaxID=1768752 RepID=UPI0009ECC4EE
MPCMTTETRSVGFTSAGGRKDHCQDWARRLQLHKAEPVTAAGRPASQTRKRKRCMTWTTPKIVEIALGCEINCYACAEIKA